MEPDNAVFHLLRRTLQEHSANWQARLLQLTKPQYAVLRAVDQHPGLEQVAVGQHAAIDKATLASLLLRLEQRVTTSTGCWPSSPAPPTPASGRNNRGDPVVIVIPAESGCGTG